MQYLLFILSLTILLPVLVHASSPIVTITNGTVQGVHSSEWNQDFFLGIPYAQPPLSDLRFRWPQPINTSFQGVFDASRYGYSCYQYGSNFNLSEDCLTINVVRPSGHEDRKLPVLVWIYGGGLTLGSTADPQYNLSGIVETSTLTDRPFIALACLRKLSSEALFVSNYTVVWNPVVDGDFLTDYPSSMLEQGKFIRVPLITGANTDEGVSFSVENLNTTTDIYNSLFYWRNYALSPSSIRRLLQLYPNQPATEPPYSNHANVTYPAFGQQWRRSAAIGGDLVMIAQRRRMAELYSEAGQKVFSYRFDTPLYNATIPGSVKHFDNVMFSFQNISGAMGPLPQYHYYRTLSTGIGKLYANFVGIHNPNGVNATNGTGLPYWPQYSIDTPTNLVLNATASLVEADTFRSEGISFINSIWRELLA
ncbi:hypothetical protein QM012_001853 [Aureobasidium pullulans]|uniref:Carboxylesterase type B domain-containing protein n=1 Tax=Aureobasidium pullulans TaxID=5580 RepID=A0ABR0TE24_AURPU